MDQEKKLDEILEEEAPIDRNAQEAPVGMTVQIGVEDERVKPLFILTCLRLYLFIYLFT